MMQKIPTHKFFQKVRSFLPSQICENTTEIAPWQSGFPRNITPDMELHGGHHVLHLKLPNKEVSMHNVPPFAMG